MPLGPCHVLMTCIGVSTAKLRDVVQENVKEWPIKWLPPGDCSIYIDSADTITTIAEIDHNNVYECEQLKIGYYVIGEQVRQLGVANGISGICLVYSEFSQQRAPEERSASPQR